MSDSEIMDQLNRLAEACPEDRCDLWACMLPGGKLSFAAYVAARDKLNPAFGYGATPKEAVDGLWATVVGKRGAVSNIKAKQEEIAKLKAEVAKLESEIDPLIGAVVAAQRVEVVP